MRMDKKSVLPIAGATMAVGRPFPLSVAEIWRESIIFCDYRVKST